MNMVDKVAIALFTADYPHEKWGVFGPGEADAKRYRDRARAAIEAMKEPTEAQLDAVRHLMMWLDFSMPTEASLIDHCKRLGKEPPPECRPVDHVPPKALRAFWIYRGMITAALSEESTS